MNRPGHSYFAWTLLVLLVITLAACATVREVDDVQTMFNEKKFDAVAAHEIKCKDSDDGCNKVYLLKGEACLAVARLDCAVDNTSKGIALTKNWSAVGLEAARFHGNLCEALRDRRDEATSGTAAAADFARLKAAATGFAKAAPDNIGAVYWTQLVAFEEAKSRSGLAACTPLDSVALQLQQSAPKAVQNIRYAAPYEALVAGVTSERHNRQCQ